MISLDTTQSLRILKESWQILLNDSELFAFPGLIWVVQMILSAVYFSTWDDHPLVMILVLPAFILALYAFGYFSQAALVGSMLLRFAGGDPEVKDGLQVVRQQWSRLVEWTWIATAERFRQWFKPGSGESSRTEFQSKRWSLETYLGIPVVIVEEIGPDEFHSRSKHLLVDTWGVRESQSISLWGAIIVYGGIGLLILLILSSSLSFIWGLALLIIAAGSAMSAIYKAALYRYAVTREMSEGFSEDLIAKAFTAADQSESGS